jgi:hypothetical protein
MNALRELRRQGRLAEERFASLLPVPIDVRANVKGVLECN